MIKTVDRENDPRYIPVYYCITNRYFNVKDTEEFKSKEAAEKRAIEIMQNIINTNQNTAGYSIMIMSNVCVSTVTQE